MQFACLLRQSERWTRVVGRGIAIRIISTAALLLRSFFKALEGGNDAELASTVTSDFYSLLRMQNISREEDQIMTISYVPTSFFSLGAVLSNQRLP
jgi:hypothetical protein